MIKYPRFCEIDNNRLAANPALTDQEAKPRGRRRPDPLADVFGTVVVPILENSPGIRLVGVFQELMRRHPELDPGVRRALERRIRLWLTSRAARPYRHPSPDSRHSTPSLSDSSRKAASRSVRARHARP